MINLSLNNISLSVPRPLINRLITWLKDHDELLVILILSFLSVYCFWHFDQNGLGLAYNDSRSHLDIGRRVVEGLKPGIAQLGSVWLPLPHILMVPTIWNDFMWHSGLAGALQSMVSFVVTGYLIYKLLAKLNVGLLGKVIGVAVFATNLNVLYLQSTAMTELLLMVTMTAGVYELIKYYQDDKFLSLIKAAFWIMLSTLVRYDGWFLLITASLLVAYHAWKKKGWRSAEGMFILFSTLAGFGIFLWLLWNTAIFHDPLYFAFGPYSAHAQQEQLAKAGVLITQKNWGQSIKTYWYAMLYCSGTFSVLLSMAGAVAFYLNKKISSQTRLISCLLLVPLVFNIIALYLGHSVLFVQGLNGDTWFNVRYGIMMMPSIAIFIGLLINRLPKIQWVLIGFLFFVAFFSLYNQDAVTIDDGRVGSSQKNVSEVSGWLHTHASEQPGFILISAASHDAIIFSSGLPMKRFIHEGTGSYWLNATTAPDRWAHWMIMRTHDNNDLTYRLVTQSGALDKYQLIESFPFADIYQLRDEFLPNLHLDADFKQQK